MKKNNYLRLNRLVIAIVILLIFSFIYQVFTTYYTNKEIKYFHESFFIWNNKGKIVVNFVALNPNIENESLFTFFDNGDYLTKNKNYISKYSSNHELIWKNDIKVHHEIEIGEENNIYVLTKEKHHYMGKNVSFDVIIKLSPEGKEIYKWSTYDYLEDLQKLHKGFPTAVDIKYNKRRNFYDYYHANSINYITENKNSKDNKFKEGNLIISLTNADLIIIIEQDTKEIVWSWGPNETDFIHTPRMMKNGHIIMYENGEERKYSRIIELDPINKKIVWEYIGNPKESFFSINNGAVQELPNGNLLVTESRTGHVFELSKPKKIIWEWYNPKIDQLVRKNVYRASGVPNNLAEIYIEQMQKLHN